MSFKEYIERCERELIKVPNSLEIKIAKFIPFPEKSRPTELKVSVPVIITEKGITLDETDPIFSEYENLWGHNNHKYKPNLIYF